MRRQVNHELLDDLPFDDPASVRSRVEIVRFNRLLGTYGWFARMVAQRIEPGDVILEIGAGGTTLLRRLRDAGSLPEVVQYRCLDNKAGDPMAVEADGAEQVIGDVLAHDGFDDVDWVVSSMLLHQFSAEDLSSLGERMRGVRKGILAREPLRRRRTLALLIPLLPLVSRVTRHDAWASVRAGFRDRELPEMLELSEGGFAIETGETFLGAYSMIATRG